MKNFAVTKSVSIKRVDCYNDTVKIYLKRPLKKTKIGFQYHLSLYAGHTEYYRMLQGELSTIISTIIKLPFVIKIFACLFLVVAFKT